MAEGEYATLRNLLIVVVVLLVVSIGSDVYLGRVMAENARVFDKIYTLLESGMNEQFTSAMTQAASIEKELAKAREHVSAATAEMQVMEERMRKVFKEAEDSLVKRLEKELPPMMDRYIESRSATLRQGMSRDEVRQQIGDIVREEMRRARPQP